MRREAAAAGDRSAAGTLCLGCGPVLFAASLLDPSEYGILLRTCGVTRMVERLLTGDLGGAFRENQYMFLVMPLGAVDSGGSSLLCPRLPASVETPVDALDLWSGTGGGSGVRGVAEPSGFSVLQPCKGGHLKNGGGDLLKRLGWLGESGLCGGGAVLPGNCGAGHLYSW